MTKPIGPFVHVASVGGELCDSSVVTWADDFTGASAPAVVPLGPHVLVTADVIADSIEIQDVDAGTLTLTPTHVQGETSTTLDPVTFTTTADLSVMCTELPGAILRDSTGAILRDSTGAECVCDDVPAHSYDPEQTYLVGPAIWTGQVHGPLCDATVTWAQSFTPDAGHDDKPPRVTTIGRHVAVTPPISECSDGPDPVSPGLLTLTPTIWLPSGASQTLDPLLLRLMLEGGEPVAGRLVVGTTGGRYFYAINTETWEVATNTPIVQGAAQSVTYSPDGRYVAATCDTVEGGIAIIDTLPEQWEILPVTPGANFSHGKIYALAWSPNGKRLAVGYAGEPFLTTLDTDDWSVVAQSNISADAVRSLCYSASGDRLAVGIDPLGLTKASYVLNSESLEVYSTQSNWPIPKWGIALSGDGDQIAVVGYGSCNVYDVNDTVYPPDPIYIIGHGFFSDHAYFSPNGEWLIVETQSGSVSVYDRASVIVKDDGNATLERIAVLDTFGNSYYPNLFSFSPDSSMLFVAGQKGFRAYNTATWTEIQGISNLLYLTGLCRSVAARPVL